MGGRYRAVAVPQHPHGEVRAEGEPRTTRASVGSAMLRLPSDPSRLAAMRLAPQDEEGVGRPRRRLGIAAAGDLFFIA